jgi:hypothetical protein
MNMRAATAGLLALVAVLVIGWFGGSAHNVARAAPPASVPTFSRPTSGAKSIST